MQLTLPPRQTGYFPIVVELTNCSGQAQDKANGRSGNNVSHFMAAFIAENSKLIMLFLLIGTIIGLSASANRPYRHETRE